MSSEKLPFKINWYLDTRYNLYDKLKHDAPLSLKSSGNFRSDRSNRYTLYIKVYSVLEKKPKLYKQDEMSLETWQEIQNINTFSKLKDAREVELRQRRANLDAIMQKFQNHNKPGIYTRKQFDKSLQENVESMTAADSYLMRIWLGYYSDHEATVENHHSAAMKSFMMFIKINRGIDDPTRFLIQDIDVKFINDYINWYTSKEKRSSRNSAISYLTDLRTVVRYAVRLGVISEKLNPFGKKSEGKYQIPKKTTRAKQFTLSTAQLKTILDSKPENYKEQKAKDFFVLGFLMTGLRIGDLIRLKKSNIKESMGEKYFEVTPKKTEAANKVSEIAITPEIQRIINKYPGEGKYIFDCIPDDTSMQEEKRVSENYYRMLVDHLKSFTGRIEGIPTLSWSYYRFSVNHFLFVNNYASRDQIAELLVHTPEVDKGYFADVGNSKFNLQKKLSNVITEQTDKIPVGIKDKKKDKKQATN